MDLKEFVSETLRQIMDGVKEAKDLATTYGADVNPHASMYHAPNLSSIVFYRHTEKRGDQPVQTVEFDVAVTATEGKQREGGAKLAVMSISLGGKQSSETLNSSVSRVKFSVPIFLP